MYRPYIVCHMVTSLDGKVTGEFLNRPECEAATEIYYEMNREYKAQGSGGFICGRVTMEQSFTGGWYHFAVLQCLRDSFVWIPVTINMNEEDLAKFTNSKVGDKVTTEHDIKFEPDILQHGTTKFFPVFSSAAEMGDYGNHFSKVEKHFFEAMSYAMAKEETVGIVVNAFSTTFIVPKELFEAIGQMTSNIDE